MHGRDVMNNHSTHSRGQLGTMNCVTWQPRFGNLGSTDRHVMDGKENPITTTTPWSRSLHAWTVGPLVAHGRNRGPLKRNW